MDRRYENNNNNNNWNNYKSNLNSNNSNSFNEMNNTQQNQKKSIPMLEIGNIIVSSTYTSIVWVILVFIVGILILI